MNKLVICMLVLFITSCGPRQSISITSVSSPSKIDSVPPTSTPAPGWIKDFSDLPVISLENIDQLKEFDQLIADESSTHVRFSPDGSTLASYGTDGILRLWNVPTGDEFANFRHHPVVMAIAFSPDGKLIASGGADKTIIVWDIVTGLEKIILRGIPGGLDFKLWIGVPMER